MSTRTLSFFVPGIPGPGGSKNPFPLRRKNGEYVTGKGGRIIINMVDAGGEKTKLWRKAVAWQAKHEMAGHKPCPDRATFEFDFVMPRPKSHCRANGNLRPDAPLHHTHAPDALKLARSTEDALTGIAWVDDSQVIDGRQRKRYANMGEKSGAIITITFTEEETLL